jgi:hypothetical protein
MILFLSRFPASLLLVFCSLFGVRILAATVELYIVKDNDNNQPNFTILSIVQYMLYVDGQPSENGSCHPKYDACGLDRSCTMLSLMVGFHLLLLCFALEKSAWTSWFCAPIFFFFCDRMKGVAAPLLHRITFYDVIMHWSACSVAVPVLCIFIVITCVINQRKLPSIPGK